MWHLTQDSHPAVLIKLRGWLSYKEVRRCPTLPQGPPCSTIGAESLSFRVRNVTGRFPLAMAAETLLMYQSESNKPGFDRRRDGATQPAVVFGSRPYIENHIVDAYIFVTNSCSLKRVLSSYRLISTGQLHGSLVPTSTSGLSTQ